MDRVERDALRAWTPVRINIGGSEPTIDWAIVHRPFLAPFFEQSAHEAMQHPFNAVFARRTPLATLDELAADAPPVAPTGLIFHMSRCGSTLVAQMLSRLSSTIVLSEAQPIDALVRLSHRIGAAAAAPMLRALVGALAGHAANRRVFLKLNAWHVLALPLFAQAFPATPWAFVFREPRAVLRSQARSSGPEVLQGMLDPAVAALDAPAAQAMPAGDYAARMIAAFCQAALRDAPRSRCAFIDYDSLPESVFSRLLEFFHVDAGNDASAMREVGQRNTKRRATEREDRPDDDIDRRAAAMLDAPYAALRALAVC